METLQRTLSFMGSFNASQSLKGTSSYRHFMLQMQIDLQIYLLCNEAIYTMHVIKVCYSMESDTGIPCLSRPYGQKQFASAILCLSRPSD